MNLTKQLKNKIQNQKAKIGILGLGYVGLPLVIEFLKKKFQVYGFDNDISKIKKLQKNQSYINYIDLKILNKDQKNNFKPTNDFSKVGKTDVIIICLPTPLNKHNNPDMKYINNGLNQIKDYLKEGQLLVLESTTYPGTTSNIILPILNKKKFYIGENFFLSYSPERQDPGNNKFGLKETPKLVSGLTTNCLNLSCNLYSYIVDKVIKVDSIEVAELTKLYENIFRSVNIGLANEMKIICEKLRINLYDVIEAASTKPFGFMPFYPGPGLGGHCIPIDPYYLKWIAKKNNVDAKFIELSAKINKSMPIYVVNKIKYALKFFNINFKNSKILIIGVAYKKNVDDTRESPSLKILEILKKNNIKINYHDPYVPILKKSRNYSLIMKSKKISKNLLLNHDCVVILTDHDKLPYSFIKKYSKMIIDTRGRYIEDQIKIFNA